MDVAGYPYALAMGCLGFRRRRILDRDPGPIRYPRLSRKWQKKLARQMVIVAVLSAVLVGIGIIIGGTILAK